MKKTINNKFIITITIIVILLAGVIIAYKLTDPYTLEFHIGASDSAAVPSMSASNVSAAGLPVPARDGWVFLGWYTDNQIWENEFLFTSDETADLRGKIDLHAKWGREVCEVTFETTGGLVVSGDDAVTVSCGEVPLPPQVISDDETKIFGGWYKDPMYMVRWDEESPVTDNATFYANWVGYYDKYDIVLPKLYVTMDRRKESIDLYEYTPITVSITNTDVKNALVDAEARIKGRGNSTWWDFDKKPYKIKLTKKADLFDMGARKDWILLANAMDHSLMRNYITFVMANGFGDPNTSESQWIHLFINDEYLGIYLLCEQTESGPHRVDIEDTYTEDGDDVGFLIQYGGSADVYGSQAFRFDYVNNKRLRYQMTDHFAVVEYPKGITCTQKQLDYISQYCNEVNVAIMKNNWDDIVALVDIDSFIDNFIISEIMLNNDMGWNFFFYKPAGEKLFLGPHWDYDQAAGASAWGGETYKGWNAGSPHPWFEALVMMDEFMALTKERWLEMSGFIHSIPDTFIDEKAAEYQADIDANFTRWRVLGTPNWRSVPSIEKEKTYEGNKNYLKTWLSNRINWIEGELGIR